MIMDEAEKTAFLIHAAYCSARFILFCIFLWYSIFSNSMFFRNVLCQLTTLAIGCWGAIHGFPVDWWSFASTLEALTKDMENFRWVLHTDINFFVIAVPLFALLRFAFRVHGFGRNFWLPLGAMTVGYPFALILLVFIMMFISLFFKY